MAAKRVIVLLIVLTVAGVAAVGGWMASSHIESPADLAARAAPPSASPILVPAEERVLSTNIVTRGTARLGLPQAISIVPSVLKAGAGLIATLPLPNTQLNEGDVVLTASGRPLFILQGELPTYRDLSPGISGDDVGQLERTLKRLGFAPGPMDGIYDERTSAAVGEWYKSTRWEALGPTRDQLARIRTLDQDFADARKLRLATASAVTTAVLAVQSVRATAERNNKVAATELAARRAEWRKLMTTQNHSAPLALETARATAEYNNRAAAAEVQAQIASRALIVLDPRQPEAARKAADAKLELARAAAVKTELEGRAAVQAAERAAKLAAEHPKLAAEQIKLAVGLIEPAEAAVKSAMLEGEMAVQSALDALKIAEFDAKLAADKVDRLAADLASARSMLGVQVPADEIVFIPALPVRVKEVTARVGDPATGTVMFVTDYQLVIDSSLPLDTAPLVKPGMPVAIDEQALGVKATGVVQRVANTPGTHGLDGYHIYFEVRVNETPTKLEGFSLRLTIPVKSTGSAVTVVPVSALSLTADGTSRVQVDNNGSLEYITVKPGLSAAGYVEVTPVNGTLTPGQLVVVGYKNPDTGALQ